jgi:hypothetical protein
MVDILASASQVQPRHISDPLAQMPLQSCILSPAGHQIWCEDQLARRMEKVPVRLLRCLWWSSPVHSFNVLDTGTIWRQTSLRHSYVSKITYAKSFDARFLIMIMS